MKIDIDINKKVLAIIVVAVAIILAVAVVYTQGYIKFGKQITFKSGQEASEAIANMSNDVEQIGSIIEDIDRKLGK